MCVCACVCVYAGEIRKGGMEIGIWGIGGYHGKVMCSRRGGWFDACIRGELERLGQRGFLVVEVHRLQGGG